MRAMPPTVRAWTVALLALAMLAITGVARAQQPIRIWHAYRDAEQEALERVVAGYKGAPVEVLALPHDAYASKLVKAIPVGEGPDIYIDAHERLGDFRSRRIVAPVGDALEEAAYDPQALAAVTVEGQRLGVPLSQKCIALYYNVELLSRALGTDDPQPPADLEGIAELASKLPEGVFALAYEAQLTYAHAAVLGAFGVRLLDDADRFGFVGEPAERSLVLVRDLVSRGVVPEDANGALVTDLFRSGRAVFAISGPWLASALAGGGGAPRVRYRVAPLPRVRATGQPMRPLLTVEALMLSPQGAARAEVRALGRHIAGAEAARIRAEMARTLTARNDVSLPEGDQLLGAFAEQAKLAVPMSTSPAMRSTWDPSDRAIRKVLRGDAEPAAALREAKHRFDDVRRPLPPPASPAPLAILLGGAALLGAFELVRRGRSQQLLRDVRRSLPAYAWVAHAAIVVGVLVMVPFVVGAATSLFAGGEDEVRYVGLANFVSILTARGGSLLGSGSFYLVLLVTVLWTVVNVAFHVGIGLVLGLLLSRPVLRLRAVYRVLLIIPWAVPSYVTALAWKGMFHRQYGAVTGVIVGVNDLFGTQLQPISWFSKFSTAFAANVATNVWLGFPFMMVVVIGALTGVPDDVLEAARVDGATRWQRLRLVTLPMIRPTLGPAVTLGAIWTFNMFNVIYLVSGGDPDGTTDILVSEAYRWAFTREAQYGYAAAYAVLIFLLLAGATRFSAWRRAVKTTREVTGVTGAHEAGHAEIA
jgi:arabinogalactan oligomer/maltooligosaccharide transport system permease protein